jgi:subfamily B ATP-binding cassette protein HlyB/CyaB
VHAVLSWSHRALLVEITSRFDALASALFVRRLLSMPLGFFAIRTVGDVTQRMAELRKIRGLVLDQSVELLTILLGGVVNAAVIGLYDPYTLLVLVVGLVLPFAVVRALSPRVADTLRAAYKAAGDWQTRAFEHFDGLASVKAMGGEVAARWRWAQDLGRHLTLRRRLGRLEALTRGASTFFEQALNLGLLLYAIHAYSVGRLTAGHVLAIAMLGGVVVSAAMTLMNGWQDLGELAVSLGRVDDVITSAEEPRGPPVRGAAPASAAAAGTSQACSAAPVVKVRLRAAGSALRHPRQT